MRRARCWAAAALIAGVVATACTTSAPPPSTGAPPAGGGAVGAATPAEPAVGASVPSLSPADAGLDVIAGPLVPAPPEAAAWLGHTIRVVNRGRTPLWLSIHPLRPSASDPRLAIHGPDSYALVPPLRLDPGAETHDVSFDLFRNQVGMPSFDAGVYRATFEARFSRADPMAGGTPEPFSFVVEYTLPDEVPGARASGAQDVITATVPPGSPLEVRADRLVPTTPGRSPAATFMPDGAWAHHGLDVHNPTDRPIYLWWPELSIGETEPEGLAVRGAAWMWGQFWWNEQPGFLLSISALVDPIEIGPGETVRGRTLALWRDVGNLPPFEPGTYRTTISLGYAHHPDEFVSQSTDAPPQGSWLPVTLTYDLTAG